MTVVAQSSVAQKIIRPIVFRPTGFSTNRLHPQQGPNHDLLLTSDPQSMIVIYMYPLFNNFIDNFIIYILDPTLAGPGWIG